MAAPILRHHTPHHDFAKANVAETTRQPSRGSREMQTPRGIDDALPGARYRRRLGRPADVAWLLGAVIRREPTTAGAASSLYTICPLGGAGNLHANDAAVMGKCACVAGSMAP
jgi:hypothetical protein